MWYTMTEFCPVISTGQGQDYSLGYVLLAYKPKPKLNFSCKCVLFNDAVAPPGCCVQWSRQSSKVRTNQVKRSFSMFGTPMMHQHDTHTSDYPWIFAKQKHALHKPAAALYRLVCIDFILDFKALFGQNLADKLSTEQILSKRKTTRLAGRQT